MFSKSRPLPQARIIPQNTKTTTPNRNGTGILLGDNCYWNPELLANPHGAIIGASGSGKTQTLKAIALESSRLGAKIVIIDFHGDQSLPGEICHQLHAASPYGINPLSLDLSPTGGGPNLQSIAIAQSFTQSLRLGPNQQGLMIEILNQCYQEKGISEPCTWDREPPNFSHLERELERRIEDDCKESRKLVLKLKATFEYGIFSRRQPDLFNSPIIRIDLSELAKIPSLQAIAAESICKQILDYHRLSEKASNKIPNRIIFIDECKELKGKGILDRIIADGRKYNLGLWVASQKMQHLSPEIISNSYTKIILQVDASDVSNVARKLRFNDEILAQLSPLYALIRMGTDSFKIKVKPFYERI